MLNIRSMKKEDLATLGEVFTAVYTAFDIGERWEKDSATRLIEYWFRKQPDLAFVAEYNGQIVGAFLSAIKPWWDGNHLFDGEVFVHPDFQNKKIGGALLKRMLIESVEKYDAKVFDAFTFNGTEYPLKWYKKIGFHEVKEWTMFSGNIQEVLKGLTNPNS